MGGAVAGTPATKIPRSRPEAEGWSRCAMGLAWLDNRSQIVADADSVDFGADYQNGSNQGPRTPLGFELSQPESRLPQNVSSADATNSLWP